MKKLIILFTVLALSLVTAAQKITAMSESTSAVEGSLIITRAGTTGDVLSRITVSNFFKDRTMTGSLAIPATVTMGVVTITAPGTSGTLATTANLVSPAMTAPTVATTINPDANDGATLGASGTGWGDMYFADGSFIDWGANDIRLTHSGANTLTVSNDLAIGGTLDLSSASIGTGTVSIESSELAALDGVTGSLDYDTENYGATGTGDIVLSTGPTLTTVNITDVIKLTPTASPPAGATEGMIYADTDHHLYYYNGTTWVSMTD